MNINRNNYEEFFILYLDNELTNDLRAEVEAFADSHPDLKIELELLLQSKLVPEEIIFDNKEALLKKDATETSIEQGIILYLDNELSPDQREDIEKIISTHPQARTEFEAFSKTKLEQEKISFPDKSVLYRHAESKRVSMFNWKRIAAAAVLFMGMSTAAFLILNKETDQQDSSIAQGPDQITTPTVKSDNEKKSGETFMPVQIDGPEMANVQTSPELINKHKIVNNVQANIEEKKLIASTTDNNVAETNNLPTPTEENPYVYSGKLSSPVNTVADVRIPQKETLTSNPAVTQKIAVTPTSLQPLYTSNTSSEEEDDVRQKGKRGGFRGFVRKITRTFEKTTDFEATDGDDRLLVAGLAIKL